MGFVAWYHRQATTWYQAGACPEDSHAVDRTKRLGVFVVFYVIPLSIFMGIVMGVARPDNQAWGVYVLVVCTGGGILTLLAYRYLKSAAPVRWYALVIGFSYPYVGNLTTGCNRYDVYGGNLFAVALPALFCYAVVGGTRFLFYYIHLATIIIAPMLEYFVIKADVPCPFHPHGASMFRRYSVIVAENFTGHSVTLLALAVFVKIQTRQQNLLERSLKLAELLAKHVNDMDLDAAQKLRTQPEFQANTLTDSLFGLVDRLEKFKPFLPDALFYGTTEDGSHATEEKASTSSPAKTPVATARQRRGSARASATSRVTYSDTSSLSSAPRPVGRTVALTTLGLTWNRLALMAVNLRSFHALLKEGVELGAALQNEFLNTLVNAVKAQKGTLQYFGGGRALAYWAGNHLNAVACANDLRKAFAALLVDWKDNPPFYGGRVEMACAMGRLVAGNAGTTALRSHNLIGPAYTQVHELLAMIRVAEVQSAIVMDAEMHSRAHFHYEVRPVDVVLTTGWSTEEASTRSPVYELISEKEYGEDEWMYQLQTAEADPFVDGYNLAFSHYRNNRMREAHQMLTGLAAPDQAWTKRVKHLIAGCGNPEMFDAVSPSSVSLRAPDPVPTASVCSFDSSPSPSPKGALVPYSLCS